MYWHCGSYYCKHWHGCTRLVCVVTWRMRMCACVCWKFNAHVCVGYEFHDACVGVCAVT